MEKLLSHKVFDNTNMLALALAFLHSASIYITAGFIVFLDQLFNVLAADSADTVWGYVAIIVGTIATYRISSEILQTRDINNHDLILKKWVLNFAILTLIVVLLASVVNVVSLLTTLIISFIAFWLAFGRQRTN